MTRAIVVKRPTGVIVLVGENTAAAARQAALATAAAEQINNTLPMLDRASEYGIEGFGSAGAFASEGKELAFADDYYRDGLTVYDAPDDWTDIALTRATAATAETAAGEVIDFASGELRVTDKGALIERASTNLLLRSSELATSPWTVANAGVATLPTVTANAATAPDGTATADQVVLSLNGGSASGDIARIYQAVSGLTNAVAYSGDIWIRAAAPCTVLFRHVAAGGYLVVNVTTTWQRVGRVETAGGTSANFEISLRGTFGSSASATIQLWGGQLALGTKTSYIATAGATATRNKDELTLDAVSSSGKGQLYVEAVPGPLGAAYQALADWSNVAGTHRITLARGETGVVTATITIGGSLFTTATMGMAAEGVTQRIAVSWDNGDWSFWHNGVTYGGASGASTISVTTLHIGSTNVGSNQFDGLIKAVALFDAPAIAADNRRMTTTGGVSSGTVRIAAADSSASSQKLADVVCDGVDDQVEINEALATAGSVFLYDGNYQVTSTGDLPSGVTGAIIVSQSGSTIAGESHDTVINLADGQFCNVIRTVGDGLSRLRISNLAIEPNRANNFVGTGSDWLEICGIKTKTTGATRNHDIWIQNIKVGRVEGLGVYLWGDDVHLRDSIFATADHDAAELCDGSKGDITGCALTIQSGETGGYGFGTDEFNDFRIVGNITTVKAGGYITVAVHRTWASRYRGVIANNIINSEGGRITKAIESQSYNTIITGNIVRGHDDYVTWGRTEVGFQSSCMMQLNSFTYCELVFTALAAGTIARVANNILEDCVAPGADAQLVFEDNNEYSF